MPPTLAQPMNIVGAGLAGTLLALMLARRGLACNLYERRADPRTAAPEGGRSINLALAARGLRALEHAGVMGHIMPLLIPLRGRLIHDSSGATTLQPYGQRAHEVIYSVGRAALNRVLLEEVTRYSHVALRFRHVCLEAAPAANRLRFQDAASGATFATVLRPTVATDGAGSTVRASLLAQNYLQTREDWLDHDYKELTLPAIDGAHALDPHALHIWPRGGFMLIALPNIDRSFTATLFLARSGTPGFAQLSDGAAVMRFFREQFPDAVTLIPDLVEQFRMHPAGRLGSVHAAPWHVGGEVLLMGDAAHAIVPFHGQGMNAAFEDCVEFDLLFERHRDWQSLFLAFEQRRRVHAEAIAQMALENYTEMRDSVRDVGFLRRNALALELERHFPDRFIPRYSMVSFHPEIPYGEALRRGALQAQILAELDARTAPGDALDLALAGRLIDQRLPACGER